MNFSQKYLDQLFTPHDYSRLVEIAALVYGSDSYRPEKPDHGLDKETFVFIESHSWFAQGYRSGMWAYYEAPPPDRLEAMLEALKVTAPRSSSKNHALGMESWKDEDEIRAVDNWLRIQDEENHACL